MINDANMSLKIRMKPNSLWRVLELLL